MSKVVALDRLDVKGKKKDDRGGAGGGANRYSLLP